MNKRSDVSVVGYCVFVLLGIIFVLIVFIHERESAWNNECVEFRGVNVVDCSKNIFVDVVRHPKNCENYVAFKCVQRRGGVVERRVG